MKRPYLVLIGAVLLTAINPSRSYAQTQELRVSDLPYRQSTAKDLQPVLSQTELAPPPAPVSQPRLNRRLIQQLRRREATEARNGFYGSVSGNARFLNTIKVRPINFKLDTDTGYAVNAALGYRFRNNLRLEGEFSYGSNRIREVGLEIPATTVKARGAITTLSGLLNLYYDIPTNSRFEPYIGGGIGGSRIAVENISLIYPGTNIRSEEITGSSTVLVYQFRTGVAYNIDSRATIALGYRYFNADGTGSYNIELGLRYWF